MPRALLSAFVVVCTSLTVVSARADGPRTYYVDYAHGSDANDGLSRATAWQRHPYMSGFAGRYTHYAGDRFVFRGNVRWPASAFPMRIVAGGTSDAMRDRYVTERDWYDGDAFARPRFDFEMRSIYRPVWFDNASYVDFEGFEIYGHHASANWGDFSVSGSSSLGVTVRDCYIHDWLPPRSTDTPGDYNDDGGGGVFGLDTVERCVIENAGQRISGGTVGAGTWSVTHVLDSVIHDTTSAIMSAFEVRRNELYNISDPFDRDAHGNVVYIFGTSCVGRPCIVADNVIHDTNPKAMVIYAEPGWDNASGTIEIFNNVVWNIAHAPIVVDMERANDPAQRTTVRIYGNTLRFQWGPAIQVALRAGSTPLTNLDVRNNLYISDETSGPAECWNRGSESCPSMGALHVNAMGNMTLSMSAGAAAGFTPAMRFMPQPGSATIDRGIPLTDAYAHDVRGMARPQGASWDIGAYEHSDAVETDSGIAAPDGGAGALADAGGENPVRRDAGIDSVDGDADAMMTPRALDGGCGCRVTPCATRHEALFGAGALLAMLGVVSRRRALGRRRPPG